MKKLLSIIAVVLILTLTLTACGAKSGISLSTFTSKAESMGYTVIDDTEDTVAEYDYITGCCFADKDGTSADDWFVMFETTTTQQDALELYEGNYERYAEGVSTFTEKTAGNNFATYKANKDGMFIYVGYVDSTVLFVEVAEQYKDEVKRLIDALGY